MAYITEADIRPGSALWRDIQLSATEVSSARVTSLIAAATEVIDKLTGDHFETVLDADLTFPSPETTVLVTPGYRLQAVDSIDHIAIDGTVTALEATSYRIRPWGVERYYLDFPIGNIRLNNADYGWTAVPSDIKRASALLIFDAVKGQSADRMLATRWQTGDILFERPVSTETGIPEVDIILKRYRFAPRVGAF